MKKLLMFLFIFSVASASFEFQSVKVTISDIEDDGSAHVQESIKFLIKGNYSKLLYDSGFKTTDDLSVWSTNTNLKQVRQHVNPAVVSIENFRLQPQPRSGCNPFLGICHGELIFDYSIKPVYDGSKIVNGTGLFIVENYKPRTTRYTLNPDALSFTKTEAGNMVLEPDVWLSIEIPQEEKDIVVNPSPKSTSISDGSTTLSWNDMVLVRLSVVFEMEESIDKEVTKFFSDVLGNFQKTISSQHGLAFLGLLIILVGSYIYINVAKKKKEE